MPMKNRILSIFIIALMSISLVACGKASNTVDSIEKQDAETQEVEATEVISTIESTENVVENAIEESIEDVAEKVSESETEVISEEPTEEIESESEESPAYTFVDMDAIKYAKSNVNVRNLPNKMGDKLGGLSQNEEIHITGKCNETGWYRFEYKGDVAYVSNEYIVDEKIEIPVEPAPATQANNTTAGHWYDNYQKYVWYDMGDYVFCIVGSLDEEKHYTFSNEANSYAEILRQRYPDRDAVYGGNGPQNLHVALISAVGKNELGHPKWDDVHYIWQ